MLPGVFGLIWCAVWWVVVKDNPEDDPLITPEELKYIKDSLGHNGDGSAKHVSNRIKLKTLVTERRHHYHQWGEETVEKFTGSSNCY